MQLRERHWRIFSLSGTLETVRGRGIIGKVRNFHWSNFVLFQVSFGMSPGSDSVKHLYMDVSDGHYKIIIARVSCF